MLRRQKHVLASEYDPLRVHPRLMGSLRQVSANLQGRGKPQKAVAKSLQERSVRGVPKDPVGQLQNRFRASPEIGEN